MEELQAIVELMSGLGVEAKEAFIFYLVYKMVAKVLLLLFFGATALGAYKLIRRGINLNCFAVRMLRHLGYEGVPNSPSEQLRALNQLAELAKDKE